MKKSIIIIVIFVFVALGAIMIGRLFWQSQFSPKITQQSVKKTQESRAAEQSAAPKQPLSTKVSSLMFDTQQQSLATGTKFALKALVDPKGKKISASGLFISYDPKMLKLESITPSDEFSLALANSQIDNEKGTASIALGVPLGKPAMDAVSTIATFNFQTLSVKGQTKVSFTDKAGAAADGETSNIVADLISTTIIVQ